MHHVGLWKSLGVCWWKCVGEWVGWAGGGYHVGSVEVGRWWLVCWSVEVAGCWLVKMFG